MKETPFHPRTSELLDSYDWTEWSGWLAANSYELDHSHEYLAIRTSCGVFDTSPLYKYIIHGPDALKLMNRVVTQDVSKYGVGKSMYTPWCDDNGKIIDDGIVARVDEQFFRMTAAEPTLFWLEDNATNLNVTIEDITEAYGIMAMQGPYSRDILNRLTKTDAQGLNYFGLMDIKIAGIPITLSRTGYTGDLGYELWVKADKAVALWDAVFEAGEDYRIRPFGDYALDIARIEAGLLLIDADFHSSKKVMYEHEKTTPLELGLGWTVKLNKDYFVGQKALIEDKKNGLKWKTIGLEIDLKSLEAIYAKYNMPLYLPYQSWTEAVPVYSHGKQIGKATSGTWSPMLKKYIAIARIKPKYASIGNQVEMEVTINAERHNARAKVVKTPFFNPSRKTN
ncbi:MAG: aminomethyltransferase family protein [Anaerolineae bacterium]|nr:aminomethyltransferase family protein [Anaerolineae bacterium]